MRKPLNIDKSGCSTVSSNCVVWQGPKLDCIGLCTGDSVTEVIYELATQLCTLMEQLSISDYDLTCLLGNSECPPETFKDMFTLLLEAVCELQQRECPTCADGRNGNYPITAYEPIGENCQYGGIAVMIYDGETNNPIPEQTKYICNGAPGAPASPAPPGPPGAPGKKGDPGKDGVDANPITVQFQANCEVNVQQVQGNPDYIFNVTLQDTGWYPLKGFAHYGAGFKGAVSGNSFAGPIPEVRRIGKQLHFRGVAIIPLAVGGVLQSYDIISGEATYTTIFSNEVFTGAGGCTTEATGAIYFNKKTSVLPNELNLCSLSIDKTITKQYISHRQLFNGEPNRLALSTWVKIFLLPDGKLGLQTITDIEDTTNGAAPQETGGSTLRPIICNVTAGEYVPKFNSTTSNLHSAAVSGLTTAVTVDTVTDAQTWPISCDGGDPEQLGGFAIELDGLIAYLK